MHNTAPGPGVAFGHTHKASEDVGLLDSALFHLFPGRRREHSSSLQNHFPPRQVGWAVI